MTETNKEVVLAYAENNMNAVQTAKNAHFHLNTVNRNLDKVLERTGLNPRVFYDLVELVRIIKEGA